MKKKIYSEADMGPMTGYDPNMGMKKSQLKRVQDNLVPQPTFRKPSPKATIKIKK